MKHIVIIVIVFLSFKGLGQNEHSIKLNWKIGKSDTITYLTVMNDIDSSIYEMNLDSLLPIGNNMNKEDIEASKNFYKAFTPSLDNYDLITKLTNNGNGIIDIIMSARPKKDSTNFGNKNFGDMMLNMNKGNLLNGSVYETGGIHSFWIRNAQKNIIALFFEMPTNSVNINESWSLDVNLITTDQNFYCDSSFHKNKVTLSDIKIVDGDTIAIINYDIEEYVEGYFDIPVFFGNTGGKKNTMMKYTHQAIGEFSISKGRWLEYHGIMTMDATGLMTAKKKTQFSLKHEQNVNN
jgi:hypothetical protein